MDQFLSSVKLKENRMHFSNMYKSSKLSTMLEISDVWVFISILRIIAVWFVFWHRLFWKKCTNSKVANLRRSFKCSFKKENSFWKIKFLNSNLTIVYRLKVTKDKMVLHFALLRDFYFLIFFKSSNITHVLVKFSVVLKCKIKSMENDEKWLQNTETEL